MADEGLRELERTWRSTGAEDARTAWLTHRLRSGNLDADVARGALFLGHRGLVDLIDPIDDVCTSCGHMLSQHPIPPSKLRDEVVTCVGRGLREASAAKWWRGFMENVPEELAVEAMQGHAKRRLASMVDFGHAQPLVLHSTHLVEEWLRVKEFDWRKETSLFTRLNLHGTVGIPGLRWAMVGPQTIVAFEVKKQIDEHGPEAVAGFHSLGRRWIDRRFPYPAGLDDPAGGPLSLTQFRSELAEWINQRGV